MSAVKRIGYTLEIEYLTEEDNLTKLKKVKDLRPFDIYKILQDSNLILSIKKLKITREN